MLLSKWQKGRQPRRLLCFSVAFFLSALLFILLLETQKQLVTVMLLTGAAAVLLSVVLKLLLGEQARLFLALPLGLLLGWLWCCGYSSLTLLPTQAFDGYEGLLTVELTDYPESHTTYGTAEGLLVQADGIACHQKVRLYLLDGTPEGTPGERLQFSGTISAASRTRRANLLSRGVMLTVSQQGSITRQSAESLTLMRRMRIFSHEMGQRIAQLLPGDEGTLLSALLCGEKAPSGGTRDQALSISGTRHVTAVSGLHVSILAGAMVQLLGKKKGLLAAVPVIFCYAAIVGFPASVIRAFVLHLFWVGSFWLKEEKDPLTALGAALLLLMVQNPFSCVSAGLLLSFGATLGLILLAGPIQEVLTRPLRRLRGKWFEKPLFYIASTTASSLAATLFTLPLNLLFFETVPLLSLLSNVLILWAVALGMELGIGLLLLSLVSMSAAGVFAAVIARWPLWWIVTVVRAIGGFRFAAADAANLFLALFSLLILVILLLWKGKLLSGRKTLTVTAVLLLTTVLLTAAERTAFGEIQIINSGGQAALLLRGDGICAVNGGARPDTMGEAAEEAMLRWNGDRAQLVLCTGEGYRTQGGLPALLETTNPKEVLLPSGEGLLSGEYEPYAPLYYDRAGAVKCGDFTAELLPVGEGEYLCRLKSEHMSLLLAAGLKKKTAIAAAKTYDCRATVLVVDSAQAQDHQTLYYLYSGAQPERIYCIASGYDGDVPDTCGGIPIQMVESDGAAVHYVR